MDQLEDGTSFIEKQDLFTARTDGYHNYRIPGLVTTARGVVVAYCEARLGQGKDWDLIDIQMRRSLDGGTTWESPQIIVNHRRFESGGLNNCVMIADRNGSVHCLFCQNYARVYYMSSNNDGVTFTDYRDITDAFEEFRIEYNWVVCATGPGHGIQLSTGRLIVPVWLSTGEGGGGHRPSAVATVLSDDQGKTWQCGDLITGHDAHIINPSETCLVELSDGRVLANIRNESSELRRLVSVSPDGANNWSNPAFDKALLEPQCMGSMIGLHDENTIAFANPDNLEQTLPGARGRVYDRKRLTLQLSHDDCRTWTHKHVIESGAAGYSDLTQNHRGDILCLYERGYNDRMTDSKYLTLARLSRN